MEERKTFNEMVAEGSLDELLEATRKLCSYKLQANNIKLPTYIGKEDVMQDAMIKVFKAYRKFDPSKSSANTYFTRIIDRVIIDHIRRAKSQPSLQWASASVDELGSTIIDLITGNISAVKDLEQGTRHTNIIKQAQIPVNDDYRGEHLIIDVQLDLKNILSDREAKIFKFKYEGYTLQEIADKLGVSRPTVAKDWLRVREVLMELLI